MALIVASMIGGISIAPAFGDNDRREGYRGQGHYERGHDRGRRMYQYQRPGPYYYHPAPVYAPPPVVYEPYPYQSPGINLVFPIRIH
jgi:hypothetical protein